MASPWTISGQVGKALDATRRTLSEVGLQSATLTLMSLEVDTLTWFQSKGIIPDDLQEISLYRDGIRQFFGTVTTRKFVYADGGGSGYSITASGALYRMSKAQIVEDTTDGIGTTATRPSFTFPPGDLRDMVIRLLTASPEVDCGTIAPMFNSGRRNFSGGTWLGVLVDMLKPVADAASWVDYSGEGTPCLNIERRGSMQLLDIRIGQDPVSRIELAPRSELKVTGISLATASRDATGKIVYGAQTSGDGSQIVSVSGPEVGAFVPPDNLPSVAIKTTNSVNTLVSQKDATLLSILNQYGLAGGYGTHVNYWEGSGDAKSYMGGADFPALDVRDSSNNVVSITGKYLVLSDSLPDWAKTQLNAVSVTITGWWVQTSSDNAYVTSEAGKAFIAGGRNGFGWANGTNGNYSYIYYEARPFSAQCEVVDASYPALTTIYPPAAYEYLTAPEGMADGMLSAANFTPYEGLVDLNPAFAYQRFLARRLNILGADPKLEDAGAIIQSATIPLIPGITTLNCGAPARVDLNSTLARYQASSKDNILVTL